MEEHLECPTNSNEPCKDIDDIIDKFDEFETQLDCIHSELVEFENDIVDDLQSVKEYFTKQVKRIKKQLKEQEESIQQTTQELFREKEKFAIEKARLEEENNKDRERFQKQLEEIQLQIQTKNERKRWNMFRFNSR
jgi:hypothetical protein